MGEQEGTINNDLLCRVKVWEQMCCYVGGDGEPHHDAYERRFGKKTIH